MGGFWVVGEVGNDQSEGQLRRMSDVERLATVEAKMTNINDQISELKTTNARIEAKLENGIAGISTKLDIFGEVFVPRKEYAESIALRDEKITANQKELTKLDMETKAELDKLEVRVETEIRRLDKSIEDVQKEQLAREDQAKSDRTRNRPHWYLVVIGALSLLSSVIAIVIAAHQW
jgi:multidrug resistance efflux pump